VDLLHVCGNQWVFADQQFVWFRRGVFVKGDLKPSSLLVFVVAVDGDLVDQLVEL
jgi:hypothetical protein